MKNNAQRVCETIKEMADFFCDNPNLSDIEEEIILFRQYIIGECIDVINQKLNSRPNWIKPSGREKNYIQSYLEIKRALETIKHK